MNANELYHFGVLGMRWGVRRYQPYPDGSFRAKITTQRRKEKRAKKLQKVYNKATDKLKSFEEGRDDAERNAVRKYIEAEKEAANPFRTNRSTRFASDRARSAQIAIRDIEFNGEEWYNQMKKAFGRINFEFDDETKKIGQGYIDKLKEIANSSKDMNKDFFKSEVYTVNKSDLYSRIMNARIDDLLRDDRLAHSAKGSTWEEHKYLKRIDGTYYYPDGYEGGRNISSLKENASDSDSEKKTEESSSGSKLDLSTADIEALALEVVRGNFGNGQQRKELLGENYAEIQKRVNEMYASGQFGSQQLSQVSQEKVDAGEKAVQQAVAATSTERASLNLDQVFSAYDDEKRKGKGDKSINKKSRKTASSSGGSTRKDRVDQSR